MRKVTLTFTGTVTINVEPGEETSEVFAELDIIHPDATRVVDFTIENETVTDSR